MVEAEFTEGGLRRFEAESAGTVFGEFVGIGEEDAVVRTDIYEGFD